MAQVLGHTDAPHGQHWHVEYTPAHDPGHRYWGAILDDPIEAQHELAHYRARPDCLNPVLCVRDVGPWREQAV